MAFITMMVHRMAAGKNIMGNFMPIEFPADSTNSNITLWMVVYGFLLIAVVQLLGTFGGSNSLQDSLMAFCGFGLYLGVGAKTAAFTHQTDFIFEKKSAYAGFAAMCILTSLVYLADFVFSLVHLKNNMVNCELRNLFKMPQILKIPELVRCSLHLPKSIFQTHLILNLFPGNGFHYNDGG